MAAMSEELDASGSVRGCVLAGGEGRRLGGAKAGAILAGRSLVAHVLDAFAAAGIDAAVVAKADTPLPELGPGVEVWREGEGRRQRLGGMNEAVRGARHRALRGVNEAVGAAEHHPLRGIVEAARRLGGGALVVCPCDLPFVPPELLRHLASLPDPLSVVASQPLLGRYSTRLRPALSEAVEGGRSVQATVAALGARMVGEKEVARFGEPGRVLFNVNTRADLVHAERLLTAERP